MEKMKRCYEDKKWQLTDEPKYATSLEKKYESKEVEDRSQDEKIQG